MLLEELYKRRYRDIEGIVAIVLLQSGEIRCGGYTTGLLEMLDVWLRFGINLVGQGGK
jgi:hypothetical protein